VNRENLHQDGAAGDPPGASAAKGVNGVNDAGADDAQGGGIAKVSMAGQPELAAPDCGRAVAPYDAERAERAVRELLIAVGEDPDREGLKDTPARVARAYQEMFAGLQQAPEEVLTTTFDIGHDEMVLVRDIELYSTCEHHLVPFHGVAHVGYIPSVDGRITGLSKLARLVDVYAKRPQVQERLTTQIADALVRILEPRGVIVVVECEHLCMSMRGIRKPGAKTVTSAVRGQLLAPASRAEAMSLILGR
jgi:GTP cyclohydrolase I